MKKRIIRAFWYFFTKIPKLKKTIYRFYAWRIFELVPYFKKFIYQIYDKFWYIELIVENRKINPLDYQVDDYNIEIGRIKKVLKSREDILMNLSDLKFSWDSSENLIAIQDTKEYTLLENHFINKVKWREDDVYSDFLNVLSNDQQVAGCSNEIEFSGFLDSLDKSFQNFVYKTHVQRIKVGIDRNGNFVLFDKLFALSQLKLLDIKNIPVNVVIRHTLWDKFSNEFLKFRSIHGELYQPLIHPDLRFKSSYTDQRFLIMKENLTIKSGTLLDIGANLGYFCHKFEDLGFNCYAVEIRPSNVHYMKKLRDIEGKKFSIINKSIFDLTEKLDYDIVIAFNIFHHFLREKDLYQKLIEFLTSLKVKVMYFQPHDPSEVLMRNAYANFDNEQFVRFIIKNSCLNKFELITKQIDGRNRPIYKIFT
jgi:2-polyprenyl-3-methyl-5-hydroxy-6-metoxy-1,4-benzoquinol methylase